MPAPAESTWRPLTSCHPGCTAAQEAKKDDKGEASGGAQKTVFISCSTLIKEVKLCVDASNHPKLDSLYAKLTNHEIPAEQAVSSARPMLLSCSSRIMGHGRRARQQLRHVSHAAATCTARPIPCARRPDGTTDDPYARPRSTRWQVRMLMELVGSTVVQQAGLSVMNAQKGVLPHGWLEYTGAPCTGPCTRALV